MEEYKKICALGVEHNLNENCNCINHFNMLEGELIPALKMIGYDIEYSEDMTRDMKIHLYRETKKEDFKERLFNFREEEKHNWIMYKKSIDDNYALSYNKTKQCLKEHHEKNITIQK